MPRAGSQDFMYRYLVQGVEDYAIYLLDAQGMVVSWNEGAQRIKGYKAEEIVGQSYELFYTEAERSSGIPRANLEAARRAGRLMAQGWRLRKDGTRFWASVTMNALRDETGKFIGFAKVTRDLSEARDNEQRLTYVANHDALTGLCNRANFMRRLEDEAPQLAYGAILAVHYIDLDRFKPVNDTYGHNAGDAVLQQVAQRLLAVAHPLDVVARLGGDEFAVLQVSLGSELDALDLANAISKSLAAPFVHEGNTVQLGASVGLTVGPQHGYEPDELLHGADLALYEAKNNGRNSVVLFTTELGELASDRRLMELKLRHAVATDAFELNYQPIVDAQTSEIGGYEALLRWTDGAGRSISPAEFIPLAEKLGLMSIIGTWVLQTACKEAAGWPAHLKVSVNVSATQLHRHDFVDTVCSALFRAGLTADRLELELTETAVLADLANANVKLSGLRTLGVLIALDDFGTGFSSLSLVNQLPLTRLKIDQSFVRQMDGTPKSRAVVSAITTLCHGYGLQTTAEGVETVEQRSWLQEDGCDQLQGYLFGRPMPASHMPHELIEDAIAALSA